VSGAPLASVANPAAGQGRRLHGMRCSAWLVCAVVWGGCSPVLPALDDAAWKLSTVPAAADSALDRQARIILQADRMLLPNSVNRSAVALRSGAVAPWVDLRLEPQLRQVWITWRGALESQTVYELSVTGLTDLDGITQPKPYREFFATGTQAGTRVTDPTIDPQQVLTLLRQRCARAGCHDDAHVSSKLNLGSPDGIESTARNRACALFVDTGRPPPRGSLYSAAPLILDANVNHGDPARSYLVYKLLGDEHILGDPMPPAGEAGLENSEIQLIIDWIRAGAATR
jgi:hypothetical protein